MGLVSYNAAASGSLMLFGEHAVLNGKQAIVTAVNRYIRVKLTQRSGNKIEVISQEFGSYKTSLENFKVTKKYDYVLTAIKENLKKIKTGFVLEISSDFPSDIGFGSSAAVVVATLKVLNKWLEKKNPASLKIYRQGIKVVRLVQGFGSGADVAASVFGGVIAYKMKPASIKKLSNFLPLVAVYSGNKISTKDVVAKVERGCKKFPKIYSNIYQCMDECSKKAIVAIKKKNWKELGELMNVHQGLQDALGVNNEVLSQLIFSLLSLPRHSRGSGDPVIYGAKISGSGLGDCVIGLGKIKKNSFPENKIQRKIGVKQIDVSVSKKGLCHCERAK